MSYFFNGTGRGIVVGPGARLASFGYTNPFPYPATGIVNGYPFSLVAWFYPTNTSSVQYLVSVGSGEGNQQSLQIAGNVTNDPIRAESRGSTATSASITSSINFNTWNVAAAIFESATSRYVSINGSALTQDTTNSGISSPVYTRLGIGDIATPIQPNNFDPRPLYGYLAHVTIYNSLLDASDCAALIGVNPALIRRQNVVAYFPLVNSGKQNNLANAKSITGFALPDNTGALIDAAWSAANGKFSNWNPPVKLMLPQRTRTAVFLASSNETVDVTGEALTTTLESVTAVSDATVAVTGEALTTTLDSVTAVSDATVALTGESLTTTLDSVTANIGVTVAVTGEALTTTLESVTAAFDATVAVTGESATTALGSVTAAFDATVAVTGENLTTTLGDVAATQAIDVTLTGEALATTLDSVSVVVDAAAAVTGEALTLTLGTISITLDIVVDLTSLSLSTELNSVDVIVDNTTLLTGFSSDTALGSVTPISDVTFLLTGLSAAAAVYNVTVTTSVSSFLMNMDLGFVTVWGAINDNQTPNWTPVVDTQGPSWGPIIDAQTPNWVDIE